MYEIQTIFKGLCKHKHSRDSQNLIDKVKELSKANYNLSELLKKDGHHLDSFYLYKEREYYYVYWINDIQHKIIGYRYNVESQTLLVKTVRWETEWGKLPSFHSLEKDLLVYCAQSIRIISEWYRKDKMLLSLFCIPLDLTSDVLSRYYQKYCQRVIEHIRMRRIKLIDTPVSVTPIMFYHYLHYIFTIPSEFRDIIEQNTAEGRIHNFAHFYTAYKHGDIKIQHGLMTHQDGIWRLAQWTLQDIVILLVIIVMIQTKLTTYRLVKKY